MKKTTVAIAMAAMVLGCPQECYAYDKAGHYVLLYAVAVLHDFSPEEAALIASGSQSLDENEVTTAFSLPKFTAEMEQVMRHYAGGKAEYAPADMPHMVAGQAFHALTEHRELVEAAHIRRIGALSGSNLTRQQRQRRLLYLGQYLHFVADEIVHPTDPMLGHADKGTQPDLIDDSPKKLRAMIHLVSEKLQQFNPPGRRLRDGRRLRATTPEQLQQLADSPPKLDPRLETIATAIETTWKPGALDKIQAHAPALLKLAAPGSALRLLGDTSESDFAGLVREHRERGHTDYFHPFDEMRAANAAHRVRQALLGIQRAWSRDSGGRSPDLSYIPFRKIELDANGEPLPTPENRRRFGSSRSNEEPFLTTVLSGAPELRAERSKAWDRVLRATRSLGFGAAAAALGASIAVVVKSEIDDGWALPVGPGGVALNPTLEVPSSIGKVLELAARGDEVVLVTADGEFPVRSIEPRSMATILRGVAAGEVPYMTIGSEPSDRIGYAKVTYSNSLRDTREGALLYRADVQFKGIFAGYPLGDSYSLNRPGDEIMGGYPGGGGESQRFWITSSRIQLEEHGKALVTARHGMKILSETTLQGQIVRDHALEAYVERLTANWDRIADSLWEFRAVQALALETALAFWVRDRQIAVDPVLLSMPPVADHTPDYAPVVVVADQEISTAGGVTLALESKSRAEGRRFLTSIAVLFDAHDQRSSSRLANSALFGGLALILALTLILVSAIPFWWIGRLITWNNPLTYRQALAVWALALVSQALLAAASAPLVFGTWLGSFDRDFLAFMATIAAGPAVLFWSIRATDRFVASNLHERLSWWFGKRIALLTYSLSVPLVTALVGLALAVLTVAIVGPIPSPRLEIVLTTELAPMNTLGQATMSAGRLSSGETIIYPIPSSLLRAHMAPFRYELKPAPDPPKDRLMVPGEYDTYHPVGVVHRIDWPAWMDVPTQNQYSVDGKPPY